MTAPKIVVIDDDPTGSQTVHSCLLLTRWDVATLTVGLLDAAPLFFILSNTRGMSGERAAAVTAEICLHLRQAAAALPEPPPLVVVSRSDSTLRGHYPIETDVIARELGPFDAHFLVPAFFEGGRITVESTHYLLVNGERVPVHQTEFARDSVFGYHYSYLPDYVAEKTGGRMAAEQVERLTLEAVRGDLSARLSALHDNRCCVVDGEVQSDLNRFSQQVMAAAAAGKRFLFRSAASLLTALAALPPQPVAAEAMGSFVRGGRAGAVVVGSHVAKTTQQLQPLLQQAGVAGIEIEVSRIPTEHSELLHQITTQAAALHEQNQTVVIYTSRTELQFATQAERLAFGEQVSAFLMAVVQHLPPTLGFLISKGGITSNDVLSHGLALTTSRVVGQILAGCSVVCCPADHPRYPQLPVVIFPGNVGDEQALVTVWRRLQPL